MSNLYFTISAFFVSFLLLIMFFSKERIKSHETKMFKGLLITSFVDTICMFVIIYTAYKNPSNITLMEIFNKIDFIQYLFWAYFFFLYLFYISIQSKSNLVKSIGKIMFALNVIISLIIIISPIEIHTANNIMYASGASVNTLYVSCAFYLISSIIVET